jgi:hypothetical protein
VQEGCTALFTAAERGYDKVVKILLVGGVNPNIADNVRTQSRFYYEVGRPFLYVLSCIAWLYSTACRFELFPYQGGYDAHGLRR